ncbi:MAG: hypothetical protein VKJ04_06385 [Vampirovibrionales bacterium]|nr:hypothetical protein [Vampirovibrionales bacterium]
MGYQAQANQNTMPKKKQNATSDSVNIADVHLGQNPFGFLQDASSPLYLDASRDPKVNVLWVMLDGIASRLKDFLSLDPSQTQQKSASTYRSANNRQSVMPNINLDNNVSIVNGLRTIVGDATVMRKITSYTTIDEDARESGRLGADISYDLKFLLGKTDREIEQVFLLAGLSRLKQMGSKPQAMGVESIEDIQATLKAQYLRTLNNTPRDNTNKPPVMA